MADPPNQDAIFHERSPYWVLAGKIYAGVTGLMILFAVMCCFIMGATTDGTYNLLGVNLIISTVIIACLMWWYRTGALAPDKLWFIILVASIILFQCITSDIYVFNHHKYTPSPTTPRATITPYTINPSPNTTVNGTTLKPNISATAKYEDSRYKVMFAKLPPKKKVPEKNR